MISTKEARFLLLLSGLLTTQVLADETLVRSVTLDTPLKASGDGTDWMQARAAAIPGTSAVPAVVITLQKLDQAGTHMYHGLATMWSDDLGKTWKGPEPQPSLDRHARTNNLLEAPVDMTPQLHKQTGKVLVTGATFWLDPAKRRNVGSVSHTAYTVGDPKTRQWTPWQRLAMPPGPKFHSARAGCTQRVDLPNGDVLLPIYFRAQGGEYGYSTVVRCSFDGTTLRYVEHGTELTVTNVSPKSRKGAGEPSLTRFGGKFYLTLRNDERGYVAISKDGLHFGQPKPWCFDDGSELGSYNTQQHWVTHSEGLYLAYTRRGANNDNVFRHRAPLFLARVDPERLVVERKTERILLPNLGQPFGNFGVCNVTPEETWVVDCLRFAPAGQPSLYIARIHWAKPNRLVQQ